MLTVLSAATIPLIVQAIRHPCDRRAWPAVGLFTGVAVGMTLLAASCSFIYGCTVSIVGPSSPDGSHVIRVMRNVPVQETVDFSGSGNFTRYGVMAVVRPGPVTASVMPDDDGAAELRTERVGDSDKPWKPVAGDASVSWLADGSARVTIPYDGDPAYGGGHAVRIIHVDASGYSSEIRSLIPGIAPE